MKRSAAPSQRKGTTSKKVSPFLSRLPLSTPLVSSTSTTANNSTGSTSAFASVNRKTALSSKVAGKKLTDQHESPNARTQNPATPMNQAHEVTSTSLKTGRTHTASPAGHVSVRGSGAAESACLRIGEASLNTPGSVDANISSYIQPIEPQRNSTGATHPMINTEPVRNATCSKPENSMPASIPGASLSVDRSHPEEEADDLLSKAVDAARRGKESLLQQYLPDLKDCCDNLVHLLVTATVYNQPKIVELLMKNGANPKLRGTPKINMEVSLDPNTVVQKSAIELNNLIRVMEPSSRKAKAVQKSLSTSPAT